MHLFNVSNGYNVTANKSEVISEGPSFCKIVGVDPSGPLLRYYVFFKASYKGRVSMLLNNPPATAN